MKKKIYTAPTLSVEEFEMNQVISTSIVNGTSDNLPEGSKLQWGGAGDGTGNSAPQAKGRGIWDED